MACRKGWVSFPAALCGVGLRHLWESRWTRALVAGNSLEELPTV